LRAERHFPARDFGPVLMRKHRRSGVINNSLLTFPAARRIRDRGHVKSVAKYACLICGRRPADATALGRNVSDEFTVPLCRGRHPEVHRCGDEAAWWTKSGIDPTVSARALWLKTHPLPAAPTNIEASHSAPVIDNQLRAAARLHLLWIRAGSASGAPV